MCDKVIIFHLKKEWFDKFKSGEKTHEYRVMSLSWMKALRDNFVCFDVAKKFQIACESGQTEDFGNKYMHNKGYVRLACGYPGFNEKDRHRWMTAKIKTLLTNIDGRMTDLEINEPVFDVELKDFKEGWEVNV